MHRSNDHDNQTTKEEAKTNDKEMVEAGEEEGLVQYNVDQDDDIYNNKAIKESKSKEHDPAQFQLAQTLKTLLISKLEEQREIEVLEETVGTEERIEFLTFPLEWKNYEQTMEQTNTIVKNVLSDVIGSTSESLTEIQPTKLADFEGGNIKKTSQ